MKIMVVNIIKIFTFLNPRNKISVILLKNKIIIYSAIKIIANLPLLYSVLNPETNSLSPSAKSNGVRLSSPVIEIIHKKNGKRNRINLNLVWIIISLEKFIDEVIIIFLIMTKIKETS